MGNFAVISFDSSNSFERKTVLEKSAVNILFIYIICMSNKYYACSISCIHSLITTVLLDMGNLIVHLYSIKISPS